MVTIEKQPGVRMSAPDALEGYLESGGTTMLRAAFEHSFFVDPPEVRARTPMYPDRARTSRDHYPGKGRGDQAVWPGDGRVVKLGDNAKAQRAWERYTGRRLERGSGYSVRHIWGYPWDPDAFTAGWNLCYMPLWAGVFTERQHPHPLLGLAVRQAAWDLFFGDDPVCSPPDFVEDPGMDLGSVLGGQPLLILKSRTDQSPPRPPVLPVPHPAGSNEGELMERIKEIKRQKHRSWLNICEAVRVLQGSTDAKFGTSKVEASSKTTVRRILRETGLDLAGLEVLLKDQKLWVRSRRRDTRLPPGLPSGVGR